MIFHLIQLKNISIFDQLILEEYLLRQDDKNFCILNEGSSPSIVMGISGKPHELIDIDKASASKTSIIKRFSGGGTVFIDENTLFISFICNKNELNTPAYPEKIMKWSESIYKEAFGIPGFELKENDFVIGNLKCGGNAQYITKDRFVQHTSFLWDFSPKKMECLLHPRKTPSYRKDRDHKDFLCTLKEHLPTKDTLFQKMKAHLEINHGIIPMPYIRPIIKDGSLRISTCYIDLS